MRNCRLSIDQLVARLLKVTRPLAQQHTLSKWQALLRRARGVHLLRAGTGPRREGESAISVVRGMMGATNPLDSAPGTIRGDFALELSENIHGSNSKASARRELGLFFPDGLLQRPTHRGRRAGLWSNRSASGTGRRAPVVRRTAIRSPWVAGGSIQTQGGVRRRRGAW